MVFNFMSFASVESNVICTESTMRVEVERSSLSGFHEDHLRLIDSTNTVCSLHSNSTHFFAVFPLNACGTQIEVTQGHLLHYPLLSSLSYYSMRTEYITFYSTGR